MLDGKCSCNSLVAVLHQQYTHKKCFTNLIMINTVGGINSIVVAIVQ